MDGNIYLLGPRAAAAAQTRQRVLASAKAVFEAEGFTRAQVRHIAWDVGLSTGAIYASFKSKAALYKAATGKSAPTAAMADASPDMLEALREAASRLQYDSDLWRDQGIDRRADASQAAADMCRAAIARAEAR
jgi:AcrR family transcriptional regulator